MKFPSVERRLVMGRHGVPIARVRNGQTISQIGEKLKYV